MRYIGKLIGAVAGLVLFHNPIGLVIGMLLGHFYDIAAAQLRPPTLGSGFIEPLFSFAGALAKSDGRVSEVEIAAAESLMARLRLDNGNRRAAIDRFNAGKQAGFDPQIAIAELRRWCGGRRDLAFLVLDLLLDLVYAEGALPEPKLALVRRLCLSLGVSDHELAALSAMKGYAARGPRGPGPRAPPGPQSMRVDPYAVLAIDRTANESEIKRAYRKLMSQHHPDKLGDVPEELKRRAEERAREINAAYERIKTERGFK
ncbi:MAG: co-chaperone DjlA [Rhodanobacteraceae bacterium]